MVTEQLQIDFFAIVRCRQDRVFQPPQNKQRGERRGCRPATSSRPM